MFMPGNIADMDSTKLLVLYLLSQAEEPVPCDLLDEIMLRDGIVNYFNLHTGLPELLEVGHCAICELGGVEYYILTSSGAELLKTIRRTVPLHAREIISKSAMEVFAAVKRASEVLCEYAERENGGYDIDCKLLDGDGTLLHITLYAPTLQHAEMIKQNFIANTTEVYRSIITSLLPGYK